MSPLLVWLSHPVVLEYPDIQLFARVQSRSQGTGSAQVLHRAAHARELLTLCWTSSHRPLELLLAPLCKVLHKWKLLLLSKDRNKYVVTCSRNYRRTEIHDIRDRSPCWCQAAVTYTSFWPCSSKAWNIMCLYRKGMSIRNLLLSWLMGRTILHPLWKAEPWILSICPFYCFSDYKQRQINSPCNSIEI